MHFGIPYKRKRCLRSLKMELLENSCQGEDFQKLSFCGFVKTGKTGYFGLPPFVFDIMDSNCREHFPHVGVPQLALGWLGTARQRWLGSPAISFGATPAQTLPLPNMGST